MATYQTTENVMESEQTELKCPKCGSTNWRCYNERTVDCWNEETDDSYIVAIGYLVCRDCQHDWTDGGCNEKDIPY